MLRKLIYLLFLLPTACSGMNQAGPPGSGGALDGVQGSEIGASQNAPGFPAGVPGPDLNPEGKKIAFWAWRMITEPEGETGSEVRVFEIGGRVQCAGSDQARSWCRDGLALRIADGQFESYVETKVAFKNDALRFFTKLTLKAQPGQEIDFDHWSFTMNSDAAYVPGAPDATQPCGGPCDLTGEGSTWKRGMALEQGMVIQPLEP